MEECEIILRDTELNILFKDVVSKASEEELMSITNSAESIVSVKYNFNVGTSIRDFEKAFSRMEPNSISTTAEYVLKMK